MLIQLTPEQISAHWLDIKSTLRFNMLPIAEAGPDEMNKLLEKMLLGEMQAWVAMQDKDIAAMIITMLSTEPGTETRNLLLYSLFGYSFVRSETWRAALATLQQFARELGCAEIIAYTKVERVIEIAKELGANLDYRLVKMEV